MTVELWMLVGVVSVLIATSFVQAMSLLFAIGPKAAASNRDGLPAYQNGFAGRAQRAVANQIEGLAMFAPLILVIAIAGIATPMTALASKVYLGSRIAHSIIYLIGIAWIRSIIFGIGIISVIVLLVEIILR